MRKKSLYLNIILSLIMIFIGFTVLVIPDITVKAITISLIVSFIIIAAFYFNKLIAKEKIKLDTDLLMALLSLILALALLFIPKTRDNVINVFIIILIYSLVISRVKSVKHLPKEENLTSSTALFLIFVFCTLLLTNLLFEFMKFNLCLGAILPMIGSVNLLFAINYYSYMKED